MTDFKWNEQPPPLVTKCCGSMAWSETTGGTYCYECETLQVDNVRQMTKEELEVMKSPLISLFKEKREISTNK